MEDHEVDALVQRAAAAARRTWPEARLGALRRLEGGVSSLTFASRLAGDGDGDGERAVVLKVAPAGLPPVRNRDVLRQARLLRRLADVDGFPVPEVLVEDPGAPPEVPPLFVMQLCPGESYEPLLDVAPEPPSGEVVRARMLAAARALGRLHGETPTALGIGDEPVAGVGEELERWHRLFGTVDADIAPGHDRLFDRLARRVPEGIDPRLLHGDYRLSNMLFEGPEMSAVIDWEIWSVGDPRCDLAWLLMHLAPAHVFHEHRPAADIAAGAGMPSRTELLAGYVAARAAAGEGSPDDTDPERLGSDLAWFLAVCHYKVAATISVIHKRERKRSDPDPKIAVAAARLDEVLDAGHAALDGRR